METRPKGSATNPKGSRKFMNKSDNFINSNKKSKAKRNILKTRGLYVVRNPAELNANDHYDDEKTKERMSSQKLSHRKFSSSLVTNSFVGNRKFITHEVIKTRKINRLRPITDGKQRPTSENSSAAQNEISKKDRIVSKNKRNNIDDGIVYVMPSRGNNNRSLTITDSSMSKRDSFVSRRDSLVKKRDSLIRKRDSLVSKRDRKDSASSLNNDESLLSESFCAGIDRIAAEVLEGWIKRKEKKDSDVNTHITNDQVEDGLYDLCVDLVETSLNETDSKVYHEGPTTSKRTEKQRKQAVSKKTTFERLAHVDADVTDHDYKVLDKFYISESKHTLKPNLKVKKAKVLGNRSLKSGYLALRKLRRQSKRKSDSPTNKKVRQNVKKNFLDTIKRELHTGYQLYKEPRNMFEALKALAITKKRITKHITFDGVAESRFDRNIDDEHCEFKSPKLLQRFTNRKNRFTERNRSMDARLRSRQLIKENSYPKQDFGIVPTLQVQNFYRTPDKRVHIITT